MVSGFKAVEAARAVYKAAFLLLHAVDDITSYNMDVACCRCQYQVFVNYIRYAHQDWEPSDEFPLFHWNDGSFLRRWMPSSPMPVTPQLKRLLTRAKNLCETCCTALSPLEAALRHSERSEEFANILKDLQWYMSVTHNGLHCATAQEGSPVLKDFPWQAKLGYQEQVLLGAAAYDDLEELRRELEEWTRAHRCSGDVCGNIATHLPKDSSYCLAYQLLEPRRVFQEDSTNGARDHKSLLWRFDPEVVQPGRRLGFGAFGFVLEVTWLGHKYAQKIFHLGGVHSLPAEADALARMRHPHIVKVLAYSEDSLLMDLMCMDLRKFIDSRMQRGTTERVRGSPFSLPAALDMMLQIAEAVSYLHSQEMAHRGLKSANILVNPVSSESAADEGFVWAKVADFGLVKTKREITQYTHLTRNVGTRPWMAPEIFGANADDKHLEKAYPMKADVYSFGILCSEILSGEKPFSDVRPSELYAKLSAAEFPLRPRLPTDCPTALASLICECWDADPRKRPSFADVCRVLTYLKGRERFEGDFEKPYGRLHAKLKSQGIWGAPSSSPQEHYFKSGIQGVEVFFQEVKKRELLWFDLQGSPWTERKCLAELQGVHLRERATVIHFDYPSEYLVQVEGLFSNFRLRSISFITTKKKYGPFGTFKGKTTPFCSDPGRVVGYTITRHYVTPYWVISSLEVFVIPNIHLVLAFNTSYR